MNYFRRIEKPISELKYKMQIAALTLNINKNKIDIESLRDNELEKINNNISSNPKKIGNFTQYFLEENKDFSESYNIEKLIFKFNKNKHFYTIFEKIIECNFTMNSLLFIKSNIFYKYDNLLNDYHRLQHKYNIYDSENSLIHKYLFNKDDYYKNSNSILNTTEDFCICFKKNHSKITIKLLLQRINQNDIDDINLEIDDIVINYIRINYKSRDNINEINENKKILHLI